MEEFERIDDNLYKAKYILNNAKVVSEIWNDIKHNIQLLEWAIKLTKAKFGQRDLVNGVSICENILINYNEIDRNIYDELIKLIYSNEQIARIVLDGASNGGFSFLLMSLWNQELKLTDEQKKFAEKEAMFKIGTKFWHQQSEKFSHELDKMGITDDITVSIDIDGCNNPIGQKSKAQYMDYLFSNLSDNQAHGIGDYDIRYHILNNPNWTIEEKQKLVFDFWADEEEYDEHLEQWEWGIINDAQINFEDSPLLEKSELSYYKYDDILDVFSNELIAKKIWKEILFCRLMHQLRPQQWEMKEKPKKLKK